MDPPSIDEPVWDGSYQSVQLLERWRQTRDRIIDVNRFTTSDNGYIQKLRRLVNRLPTTIQHVPNVPYHEIFDELDQLIPIALSSEQSGFLPTSTETRPPISDLNARWVTQGITALSIAEQELRQVGTVEGGVEFAMKHFRDRIGSRNTFNTVRRDRMNRAAIVQPEGEQEEREIEDDRRRVRNAKRPAPEPQRIPEYQRDMNLTREEILEVSPGLAALPRRIRQRLFESDDET